MASLKQDDSFLREIELLESKLTTDKPKQSGNVLEMLGIPTVDEPIVRDMIIRSRVMLIKKMLDIPTVNEPRVRAMTQSNVMDIKTILDKSTVGEPMAQDTVMQSNVVDNKKMSDMQTLVEPMVQGMKVWHNVKDIKKIYYESTEGEPMAQDTVMQSNVVDSKKLSDMQTLIEPMIQGMMMRRNVMDIKKMLGLPPTDDLDELIIRDMIMRIQTWDIKIDKNRELLQEDIRELKDCVYIPQVDDTMCKERLELLLHTLEKISKSKSKGLTNTVASQLDNRNGFFPRHNVQLKENLPSPSFVQDTSEDFKIYLDCKQFKSSELKLSVENGYVVVHGKHDMKMDAHGPIQREFTRRWPIPKDVKAETFDCLLDRYGIFAIRAPRVSSSITVSIQTQKL